jgi:hypothetical protein
MRLRCLNVGLLVTACAVGPAAAHHSNIQFDLTRMITVEGTVTRYDFRNPHVYLYLETEEPDGSTAVWELEATSTPNMRRRGWTPATVAPGDHLSIDIYPPRREGDHIGRLGLLYFDDGSTISALSGGAAAPATARATSLAGRWYGRSSLGQMQLDRVEVPWPLTAQGEAARIAYDGTQNPQVDCIPMTAPTIMLYTTVFDITLSDTRMDIAGEWLSFERTVWLDGRDHPPATERFSQGHSIGYWEGDTLVIDSRNFTDHAAGLSFEIPSGAGKHVVERLTLDDEGKNVHYAFTIEDPEYLTAPVSGEGRWEYRPDLQRQQIDCDREVARRFTERLHQGE